MIATHHNEVLWPQGGSVAAVWAILLSYFGAYGKAGNGNEMEPGNGNWKLKTEMETQPLSSCNSHSNVVGFRS